jgi:hypothetical protein
MKKYLSALFTLAVLLVGPTHSNAQSPPYYPLIVNGSESLKMEYTGGYFIVRFRRTVRGAGGPESYDRNVPPGAAAWVDRPLNDQEPVVLKQKMSKEDVTEAWHRLREKGGYWRFYCRNTNAGYFEAVRSGAVHASSGGRFD